MADNVIKDILLHSIPYQFYKGKDFLPITMERFKELPDLEKTKLRVCYYKTSKIKQIRDMIGQIIIDIVPEKRFQMWLDTGLIFPCFKSMTDNIPPNYSMIINNSLNALIDRCDRANIASNNNYLILISVENYLRRIIKKIDSVILQYPDDLKLRKTRKYFERMLNNPADSVEEALQRILFWSSLFWQSRHRLLGLGRLDKVLASLVSDESEDELQSIIIDFCNELHRYYPYKSESISKGDTGQIIILGGLEPDNTYFCNCLTYAFIKSFAVNKLPDPKLLLRVSNKMPDDLLEEAVRTIGTGVGCPLLSNDDVVIPALKKFWEKEQDAYNYVTSACWEPVAYGKSLEKNNIISINFADCIVKMYEDSRFEKSKNFQEVVDLYCEKLKEQLEHVINKLDNMKWEENPLMSLFTEGCATKGSDISKGGAVYNDYGVLSAGMGNAVNSLLCLKKIVFSDVPQYSLHDMKKACVENYQGYDNLKLLLSSSDYYGCDSESALGLVKLIADVVNSNIYQYKNKLGGRVKWGLSSSSYLELGRYTKATMDGRGTGEPLMTHISNKRSVAFTELISFASKLDYSGVKANGNVVDFFVSPTLINSSFNKFVDFIKKSIQIGFFQCQMNVVNSQTLIDAKREPKKYSNLIVRVWGFSAYFNDLPEEYKNILIQRAKQGEGIA